MTTPANTPPATSTERRGDTSLTLEKPGDFKDPQRNAVNQLIELVNAARRVGVPGVPLARPEDGSAAGLARKAFGDQGDGVEPRRKIANLATAYILDKRLNAMSAAGELGLTRERPRSVTDQLISRIPGEQRGSDTMSAMLSPLLLMEVTRPPEFYRGAAQNEFTFGTRILVLLTRWYNYVGSTILVWIDNSGAGGANVTAALQGDRWDPPGTGHVEYEHVTPGSFHALDQKAGAEYRWVFKVDWTATPDHWARP